MICLLWDESHLWGVLLLRALRAWGLPCRLMRAHEAADGALLREPPALLAVPGGFASRKAACLGPAGLEAVRAYVQAGGAYLGICGGAGLGLTVPGGLGLCPWTREPFGNRLQHFASGDVRLVPRPGEYTPEGLRDPLAPVWWPAKFRPHGRGVEVVAAYGEPGKGFMMADILLELVPKQALEDWEALYGVRLAPAFGPGDPCIVAGRFGKGRYVLSHAHLETPQSPAANAWLGHILATLSGLRAPASASGPAPCSTRSATQGTLPGTPPIAAHLAATPLATAPLAATPLAATPLATAPLAATPLAATPLAAPAWRIGGLAPAWDDPVLVRAMSLMQGLVELGQAHGLLHWREPWLLGWRQGLPGAQLSGILAMLDQALALAPSERTLRFFERRACGFARDMELLAKGLSGYLLAERLAMSLSRVDPEAVPERGLKEARMSLFGPPPGSGGMAGGLCGRVLAVLEECIFLTEGPANNIQC